MLALWTRCRGLAALRPATAHRPANRIVGCGPLASLPSLALILVLVPSAGCHLIDEVRARRTAREGNTLYRAADYQAAIVKYQAALALDPSTPNAHLNLGYALFNTYDPDSREERDRGAATLAIAALDQHLSRAPDDEKARAFRVKIYLRAAPRDAELADVAFVTFTRQLEQHPADTELRHALITLLMDCRRYEQAVDYFRPHLKAHPDDTEAMLALALIADKSGKLDEAIMWYRRRADAVIDRDQNATLNYELGTYVWNLLQYAPEHLQRLQGLKLADQGIEGCRRAMAAREDYAEAMAYANLLYLKRAGYEPNEEGAILDQSIAARFRAEASRILLAREEARAQAEVARVEVERAHATSAETQISSLVRTGRLPVDVAAAAAGEQDVAELMIKTLIVKGYADGHFTAAERAAVLDYAGNFGVEPAMVDAIEQHIVSGTANDTAAEQVIRGEAVRH
jgi:Flp pilus assembly protein TadD